MIMRYFVNRAAVFFHSSTIGRLTVHVCANCE